MGKKYYDRNSLMYGIEISKCLRKLNVAKDRGWTENFFLSWRGLSLLLFSIVALWLLYAIMISIQFDTFEQRGQSGDMFGGITALFSGLAFAGLIFTLFVQKKELQYQREELAHLVKETKDTKVHLKDQATHLASQANFIEKQVFENTFFQLLSSFNQYVNGIENNLNNKVRTGVDALEVCHATIQHNLMDGGDFDYAYEEGFRKHKNDLGPYFRQIYNILKFLHHSNVENKKFYSNILRSQLSSDEISLLAYNGASSYGRKKMAPLMREFDLLKHFDNLNVGGFGDHMFVFYKHWDFMKSIAAYLKRD